MSNLTIQKPEFIIIGHRISPDVEAGIACDVLAECPSATAMTSMVNVITANRAFYGRWFDFITIKDKDGDHVATHWLVEKPVTDEQKALLVMNSHQDLELVIYAHKAGKFARCRAHNTDIALAIAHNWQELGYDVEIDDSEDWKVYFDSETDFIIIDETGDYEAVYLVGSR